MLRDAKRRNLESVDSQSKKRIHGDRPIDMGINITKPFHGRLQLSDLVDSGKSNSKEDLKDPLNEPVPREILRVAAGALKCRACRLRRKHVPTIRPLLAFHREVSPSVLTVK